MKKVLFILATVFFALFSFTTKAHAVGIPILMYHYIGNNPNPADKTRNSLSVSPDNFARQMQAIVDKGYTPVTLDQLPSVFAGKLPGKHVVLTFDDGYIDFFSTAFPILKQYNFHAVSFIPTGLVGGGYFMNWDQIKQLAGSGLISFEAHSVSHISLNKLSQSKLDDELGVSKSTLESQTGQRINFVAYPGGAGNGFVYQEARKFGYVGGVGTWSGWANGISWNMPRIRMFNWTDLRRIL